MSPILLDIILLVILLLSAYLGYQKGFVLMLCSFLAVFVAFLGAGIVSNLAAKSLAQVLQPLVETRLEEFLSSSIQGILSTHSNLTEAWSGSTGLNWERALELLQTSSLFHSFTDSLGQALQGGLLDLSVGVVTSISQYITILIARRILFGISFVLILIIWSFASRALNLAFQLPVLSTLNRTAGLLFGLLRTALLIWVVCWLLKWNIIPEKWVHNSYLLKEFCQFNPIFLRSLA